MSQKYGLLVYSTDNLGDEIQSLAAQRFLPSADYHFDRDALPGDDDLGESVKLIMNGWFSHLSQRLRWPPSKNLDPLITSFHISPGAQSLFLSESGLQYLKEKEPIGCRDLYTLGLLRRRGIKSFFSACLTLTLNRPSVERDDNLVVANDLSEEMLVKISKDTDKHVVFTSNKVDGTLDAKSKFQKAEALLRLYAKASCVVTTRLHCALPCIAMNTPVLLINRAADTERFFGLNAFVFNTSEFDFLAQDRFYYDFENPIENPKSHLPYRELLIQSVERFIGAS